MFKAALITYLSFATAFGPMLCCCTARHVFPVVAESGCCANSMPQQSGAQAVATGHAHHHSHAHSHSHAHHSDQVAQSETGTAKHVPSRSDHSGQKCTCHDQHAYLTASHSDGLQFKAAEVHDLSWSVLSTVLLIEPELCGLNTALGARTNPANLYGRELLRAYQILRC